MNMQHWQRIIYVSRATFPTSEGTSFVEPEVGRILMQSRRNNPYRGLVGALYYGDGHFFQCLEGPVAALDKLLADLSLDRRHTDIRILSRSSISQPSFSDWSMKYVAAVADVRNLLAEFGHRKFDPYQFDEKQIERMIALLRQGLDSPPIEHAPATARPNHGTDQPQHASSRTAAWSLGMSIAALLCSLAALAVSLLQH